ncbi:MAG: histidinol-phosphatase HisJ family protein [Ruminococcaceae bacterium]|nr:histidinol-phosphatase HisJ family protein [Oscillospiraceae bacterium]
MYKQNLHTHCTYCDGKDMPEEMILTAIDKGFDSIGFSSHSYMHWNGHGLKPQYEKDYLTEIRSLAKKYRGQIDVFCGLEFDMYSEVDIDEYDYVIGSVHYMDFDGEMCGFDRDVRAVRDYIKDYFDGDGMAFCRDYYDLVSQLPDYGDFDILGHFDLCVKLNQKIHFVDEGSPEYLSYAFEAIDSLRGYIPFFELNTGCISRGYRSVPYPIPRILKEFKRQGFGVCITSDCHDSAYLDCNFAEARELLLSCGFKEHYVLTNDGFVPDKL